MNLRAAIEAGCDAVYFGLRGLNMRAGAENFALADLKKIAALCRRNNVRAYLSLNTIIYERELTKLRNIIAKARQAQIDAVICWDFAVIREALAQDLPVCLSTQMSVSNSQSMLFFFNNLGVRRFVLARECSLGDMKKIKKALAKSLGEKAALVEIEVFAHGAMCVSISGRCFLSQFQYGKSANRGQCIQPCRREYRVVAGDDQADFSVGTNYILSPKDLCTLPFIDRLIDAGVSSLKIEGRNRSPEYVGTVTAAYRKAVDYYVENRGNRGFRQAFESLKQGLVDRVTMVYNRGFSSGFFLGKPVDQWTDTAGSKAPVKKEYVGVVTNFFKKQGVAEIKVESNGFKQGDEILFQGKTTGFFTQTADSIEVDHVKINEAHKGTLVALQTNRRTRPKDTVYVIKKARQGKAGNT